MKIGIETGLAFKHRCWIFCLLTIWAVSTTGSMMFIDAAHAVLTKKQLLMVFATCSIVNITLFFLFSYSFVRPLINRIRPAAVAAHKLVCEENSTTLKIGKQDELAALTQALTQMASSTTQIQNKMVRDNLSLNHQATHDDLTGLSNRKYGNETIAKLENKGDQQPTSILFLDLDGFKAVNDTCGHSVGDEILIAVSLRLKATLSKDTELIRWGGDEFVIVLPGADKRKAISTAQDVAALFRQPIATSDGVHKLGCSIGMSTSRADTSLEEVLQEADASMYEQKKKRHSSEAQSDTEESVQWPENDLGKAA